jgi:hypothetical protein
MRKAPGVTFIKGTVIELDSAGTLCAAVGADNLPVPAAQQLASAVNGGGGIGWVSN